MASHDFTSGSLVKKMLLFSLPFFISNLLQASYQFIDSLWVGNLLGTTALAAVSLSSTLIFAVLSFIIGINRASLTILSQLKGQGDARELAESLNAFVVVLGLLALLLGGLGVALADPLLTLMGTPDSVLPAARIYLQINFLGIFFLFGYNFISTILRALGDSQTPVRFVVTAVVLNAALDPLFIATFGMGIAGAALATITAQGVAFLYGLVVCIRGEQVPFMRPRLPARRHLSAIFRLGIPGGLQTLSISGGTAAIMGVAALFGGNVLAGYGAARRIAQFIIITSLTMGSVITSMAGQNIGAGHWDRVNAIARNGLMLTLALSLAMSTVVFVFAGALVGWFIDDPATLAFGSRYLQAVAFFFPFLGINFALNGVVRAAGAMFQVFVLNLISFWVLRFPLSYLFSQWFGAIGIAYGIGTSFILSSAIAACYYRFGGWRHVRVL